VRDLQAKLHHAARQEAGRRFHALYDKLYLPWVLEVAWDQVRHNQGAAGSDGLTLAAIEAQGVTEFLAEIAQALRERTYRPHPVRRVLLPKGQQDHRPLGIPTVRDRVVPAAAKLLLEPIFEADFEGTPSCGFRPGLGPQDALAQVAAQARQGYRWVVDADIQQFFDTLDHQRLLTALRRRISDGVLLQLIYRWLKAGYLWEGSFHDTDQGSPQGGVLSPLLANVYLWEFDQAQGQQRTFVGRLTRYADDFVIQCGTRIHAERALAWVGAQVTRLGLRLHPEKTRLVEDREGFDFLGFHHRRVDRLRRGSYAGYGVLRWPGRKAQQRFRDRVRQLLVAPQYLRQHWSELRGRLQRYVQGYRQYYGQGQSSEVFQKLDRYLAERVARHLARSQPTGKRRRRQSWRKIHAALQRAGELPTLRGTGLPALRRRQPARVKYQWKAV
jgi:group II intron reverse transcriptase/maturase